MRSFDDLHDLVMAAAGHHAGILIVRSDNDPRHNLTDRGIGAAITKPEVSELPTRDRINTLSNGADKAHNFTSSLLIYAPRRPREISRSVEKKTRGKYGLSATANETTPLLP